jgi:hypothetical protein
LIYWKIAPSAWRLVSQRLRQSARPNGYVFSDNLICINKDMPKIAYTTCHGAGEGRGAGIFQWEEVMRIGYAPAWIAAAISLAISSPVGADNSKGYLVSSGTSSDLDVYRTVYDYEGRPYDIVGIGIAGSNDHVYVWHSDGTVTSGTSHDLDGYRATYTYSLPPGKSPDDIVGMGIAGSNDHVYAWYADGTVSSGTSNDLDAYRAPYTYTLPGGRIPNNIRGIGIAGSNDYVYVWYDDLRVSAGTSSDLGAYKEPYQYAKPPGQTLGIAGMGIAGSNDHVYTWYKYIIP